VRVFVVDDHEIVRRGIERMFEVQADVEWVGDAPSTARALERIPAARPDVVLIDIDLGDGDDGLDLCERLREAGGAERLLLMSGLADPARRARAILAGAHGFVPKSVRANRIVDAIRRVDDGELLHDGAARAAAEATVRRREEERAIYASFTPTERAVFDLLAEGLTSAEMAERLSFAEKTIRNNVSFLLARLGLHTRAEIAVLSLRWSRDDRSVGSDA
jgi:two-component system response regulator DevR